MPADNFQDNIHNEEYENQYLAKPLTYNDMIYDDFRAKESLNGKWHFQVDWYDTCLRAKWYQENYYNEEGLCQPVDFNFDDWEEAEVPSCWNLQKNHYYYYEGPAVYTRTFKYRKSGGERVFIKFGAANYNAKVFLNREFMGCHTGGSTPFYIEATGKLLENNRIIVVVDSTRKKEGVPCRNTDWFNYGGLYRDIEMIRVPDVFIRDFTIGLLPGSNFNKIRADLTIDGDYGGGEAVIVIEELGISEKIILNKGIGGITINAAPELWSPDNPKLYDIEVKFMQDKIKAVTGFREIKASGTDILLNGEKVFFRGVCMHEESMVNGKAVTEEEIKESMIIAKSMGCNFIRLAHYPHTQKAALMADSMGLMLWEEIPVYWSIDFGNSLTYDNAENQLREMIRRDRNRPSVVVWSVGNENADTDRRFVFMRKLADAARDMDRGRLISAACLVDHKNLVINDRLAEYLDIIGINEYYGWYDPEFGKLVKIFNNSRPLKPVVITEFGADAAPGAAGQSNGMGTVDFQADIYSKQIDVFKNTGYIKGTCPWILFDFRCPRRSNGHQRGYNTKGLLTADKKHIKPSFYLMREFYAEKAQNFNK